MAPFKVLEVVFVIAECGLSIAASETQVWILAPLLNSHLYTLGS